MGMYDSVVFLDQPLTCPAGHPVGNFQTKRPGASREAKPSTNVATP